MGLSVIILAAGQGTRMRSALPKVLHPLAGRPLLEHVIHTAHGLNAQTVHVVYGYGGDAVPRALAHLDARWVEQAEQLGTGHAVAVALGVLPPATLSHPWLAQATSPISDDDTVLVLYGDVPLISTATLQRLIAAVSDGSLGLLTVHQHDPSGYGRIVRDEGRKVTRIVEEKDATADERAINEINTGMIAAPAARMRAWLARLENNNAQKEYYLTDVIALAVRDSIVINTVEPDKVAETMGINNKAQLAELERYYQRHEAERLMLEGVTLLDPLRLDVRGEVSVGQDVTLDVNVVLEGKVTLGDRVRIGPQVVIRNARIGDDVEILSHCVIEDAVIEAGCRIGPFARIRPETILAAGVHIGNFVEIKKSRVGAGTKINHLSYVGDAIVGREVNIGAGTITCNYDGASKHQTVIEDGAFIGSDTQLVAPVTVGAHATVGAGSTITQDVPPEALAVSRVKQSTVPGWERPAKKK